MLRAELTNHIISSSKARVRRKQTLYTQTQPPGCAHHCASCLGTQQKAAALLHLLGKETPGTWVEKHKELPHAVFGEMLGSDDLQTLCPGNRS